MARSAKSLLRTSTVPAIAAFVASALVGTAQASTLTVGPIEHVNLRASTVTVLGQTYKIAGSTAVKNSAGAPLDLASLAPDTMVSIDGSESASGSAIVSSLTSFPQLDVPGATRLFVSGVVTSENATGQIKVGNLTVDINSTLASGSQGFAVGSFVQISGTQPNPGGLFLAQSVRTSNGIIGGGASSNGIIGGGASSNGIIGGGASSNGIIGGGASSNGIIGGGASSNGIIGGGASSNGIIGGGAKSNGIIGGGAKSNGIIGGGLRNKGIIGGGASSNGIIGGGSH